MEKIMNSLRGVLLLSVGVIAATLALNGAGCGGGGSTGVGGASGKGGAGGLVGGASGSGAGAPSQGGGGTAGASGNGGSAGATGVGGSAGSLGGSAGGAGGSAGSPGGGGGGGGGGLGGGPGGSAGATSGTGAGGTLGNGGSVDGGAGTDGTTAAFAWYFDTSTEGFTLSPFGLPGNLFGADASAPPTLVWDGTAGNPSPGSLALTGTFTDYDQSLFTTIASNPPVNGTGKTIHAWVKLDAGSFPSGGGVQIQASSAGDGSVFGTLTMLSAGTWVDVTLDLGAAHTATPAFDPSQLTQIGIQFSTGDPPAGAGAFTTMTPTFHIDSVSDGSGAAPPLLSQTFDTGLDGYLFTYDLGTVDAGTLPTMTFDPADGSPSPGSLAVTATFTDFGQSATPYINLSPAVDLTGQTLHGKVKLDTGTLVDGYAVLFASSTANYVWTFSAQTPLTAGVWTDLTIDINAAHASNPTFDPTVINQVGVQFVTNMLPTGGSMFPATEALSFHADTIYATKP
jgi:hypothetical protein